MIYTFRYAGNKFNFLPTITDIMLQVSDRSTLIEPFAGSGVVTVNMKKFYLDAILNDLSVDVMDIHEMFKNATPKDIQEFYSEFPEVSGISDKATYYKFRDSFNKKYYFSDNKIKRGLGLYHLAGACINSMFRVGPNGFNQSAANQDLSRPLTAIRLAEFRKIYRNIHLVNKDAFEIINSYKGNENATFFIDPPYNSTTLDYGVRNDKMKLIDLMIECQGSVIYTDYAIKTQHQILTENGFKFKVIRKNAPNIAVGGNIVNNQTRHEIIYFKIR